MFSLNKFQTTGHFLVLTVFMVSTIVVCADCCTSRVIIFTDIVADRVTDNNNKKETNLHSSSSYLRRVTSQSPPPEVPEKPPDKNFIKYRKMNNEDQKLIESARSECSPHFGQEYCLNGGRCFNYTIDANNFLPSCECSGEFKGERCERKYTVNSGFYGIYPKEISLAKVCIGSFLAAIAGSVIIYLICVYVLHHRF